MRKYCLLLLLCIGAQLTHAQTAAKGTAYFDVVVSDTVQLRAVSFTYKISAGMSAASEGAGMFAAMMRGLDTSDTQQSMEALRRMLRDNAYAYTEDISDKYNSKSPSVKAVYVTVTSEPQLVLLRDRVARIEGVSGTLYGVDYESPDKYFELLFRRLYDKAQQQAKLMAWVAGQTSYHISSATETPEPSNSYEDMLGMMTKKMPMMGLLLDGNTRLTKTYTRRMTFRYEMQ